MLTPRRHGPQNPFAYQQSAARRIAGGSIAVAEYHRPRSIDEAVAIAARGGVVFCAGCTDLFPVTQAQVLPGDVIDLSAVDGLRGITREGKGWRIGAGTTWSDLQRATLPPAFDGLKAAAREVGSVQIQNAGTLGGNLCTASPAADGVPCLLTLDAQVELVSAAGIRHLPLGKFLTSPRRTALQPGEMLSAVLISADEGRGAFLKLGARRYLVISIAMVAARLVLRDGHINQVALAVGACSPVALRLTKQEAALRGVSVADAGSRILAELVEPALSPIDDIRAEAGYRKGAATELLRRIVTGLAQEGPT